jgi:hypothetical protein
MEKGKSNLFDWLIGNALPEGTKVVYNPNDNTVFSSRLEDDNGNVNLFKMIVDEKAPELTQRIYAQ